METAIIYALGDVSSGVIRNVKDLKESVLKEFKRLRKGLSNEQIKEKGYDVYEKRGITFDSIFKKITELEHVTITNDRISLTSKGKEFLMNVYTNNYSEAYLAYRKALHDSTEKRDEPIFNEMHIASCFWHGYSVESLEETYYNNDLQEVVTNYHKWSLELLNKKVSDEDYILHINPTLYVDEEDFYDDVDVHLTVTGIDGMPENFCLNRPHPNQRYVVSGIKPERKWYLVGLYPLIGPKEKFKEKVTINLIWNIGNEREKKVIIHKLNLSFKFETGRFFSTEQSIRRSNEMLNLKIRTNVEKAELLDKNRNKKINIENNGKFIEIEEDITLTSFPMHLHSTEVDKIIWDDYRKKWAEWREANR